jgi:hypothetical protein
VFGNGDGMKRDLACVGLASDFTPLSRDILSPDLQAHGVETAKHCGGQADREPEQRIARSLIGPHHGS